jgi:two-component sensor histidine kinase
MPNTQPTNELAFQFPSWRAITRAPREQKELDALTADVLAGRAREDILLREKVELLQRHAMLSQEFEHRLLNSLQSIVGLLTLQSRNATTAEAATQLTTAARRVSALGRVHVQLHRLDRQDKVEFKEYLEHLCGDLSDLLGLADTGYAIAVDGATIEIPTALAIPLGSPMENSPDWVPQNALGNLLTENCNGAAAR